MFALTHYLVKAHFMLSFYNSIWLIFNDIVIGWSFGSFLLENKETLSEMVYFFIEVTTLSPIIV